MDTLGDAITRIRNAYRAGKRSLSMPYAGISKAACDVLKQNGYITNVSVVDAKTKHGSSIKQINVDLTYIDGQPAVTAMKRVSKPGRRTYARTTDIPHVLDGFGMAVVSTSQGVLTDKEARKKGVGGETLFIVW